MQQITLIEQSNCAYLWHCLVTAFVCEMYFHIGCTLDLKLPILAAHKPSTHEAKKLHFARKHFSS